MEGKKPGNPWHSEEFSVSVSVSSTHGLSSLPFLKFTGRFDKEATYDLQFSTILINDDIVIATFPAEPFIQLQLDWKAKVDLPHRFLFGYTWHAGTWPNYVLDIKSAAQGGYGRKRGT